MQLICSETCQWTFECNILPECFAHVFGQWYYTSKWMSPWNSSCCCQGINCTHIQLKLYNTRQSCTAEKRKPLHPSCHLVVHLWAQHQYRVQTEIWHDVCPITARQVQKLGVACFTALCKQFHAWMPDITAFGLVDRCHALMWKHCSCICSKWTWCSKSC